MVDMEAPSVLTFRSASDVSPCAFAALEESFLLLILSNRQRAVLCVWATFAVLRQK